MPKKSDTFFTKTHIFPKKRTNLALFGNFFCRNLIFKYFSEWHVHENSWRFKKMAPKCGGLGMKHFWIINHDYNTEYYNASRYYGGIQTTNKLFRYLRYLEPNIFVAQIFSFLTPNLGVSIKRSDHKKYRENIYFFPPEFFF